MKVIQKEKAKLSKKAKSAKETESLKDSDSDSDSDMSVSMMEQIPSIKKRKAEEYSLKQLLIKDHQLNDEEKAFLRKINAETDSETTVSQD